MRLPTDVGVPILGAWYLFAMSEDGVPSVTKMVFDHV